MVKIKCFIVFVLHCSQMNINTKPPGTSVPGGYAAPCGVWIVYCCIRLTFGELRSSTSCFETVFLTLFHSRVTSQESCALEYRSVVSVCLKKCSCDTVTDRTSLSCVTAAFYVYNHIEFICCACSHERLANNNLQSLKSEILVNVSFIDRDLTCSRYKINSCY